MLAKNTLTRCLLSAIIHLLIIANYGYTQTRTTLFVFDETLQADEEGMVGLQIIESFDLLKRGFDSAETLKLPPSAPSGRTKSNASSATASMAISAFLAQPAHDTSSPSHSAHQNPSTDAALDLSLDALVVEPAAPQTLRVPTGKKPFFKFYGKLLIKAKTYFTVTRRLAYSYKGSFFEVGVDESADDCCIEILHWRVIEKRLKDIALSFNTLCVAADRDWATGCAMENLWTLFRELKKFIEMFYGSLALAPRIGLKNQSTLEAVIKDCEILLETIITEKGSSIEKTPASKDDEVWYQLLNHGCLCYEASDVEDAFITPSPVAGQRVLASIESHFYETMGDFLLTY
jgi:hypothetical protein